VAERLAKEEKENRHLKITRIVTGYARETRAVEKTLSKLKNENIKY